MHATIRRYDGVDQNRIVELTDKVNETLVPKLSKMQGFKGYYLIDGGNGVFSSLGLCDDTAEVGGPAHRQGLRGRGRFGHAPSGLFETSDQAEESTKLVSTWIRDERLESLLPNPPKITSGKVMAQKNGFVAV